MNDIFKIIGILYIVFIVILATNSNIFHFYDKDYEGEQGNTLIQVLWIMNYLVIFTASVIDKKTLNKMYKIMFTDKYLLALTGLIILSIIWSESWAITLRRSVALLGILFIGIYLAAKFSLIEHLKILSLAFSILIFLSIFFVIFLPEYGIKIDSRGEHWLGAFINKNGMGRIMGISGITFFIMMREYKNYKSYLFGLLFIISVILLIKSHSMTSVVMFFVTIACTPFLFKFKAPFPIMVIFRSVVTVLIFTIAVYIAKNYLNVMSTLGRDPTLTGRTIIWVFIYSKILKKPWLGYGYKAYWESDVWEHHPYFPTGWSPNHAHNGLLEVALDVGLIGMTLFLLSFIFNYRISLKLNRTVHLPTTNWPILYLLYFALSSISQSIIVNRNDIFWLLYILTAMQSSYYIKLINEKQVKLKD